MDGTPGSVWDCVKPLAGSLREKWDENVTSFEVIQSFTDVSLSKRRQPWAAERGPSPAQRVWAASWRGEHFPSPDTSCLLLATLKPSPGPGAGSKRCGSAGQTPQAEPRAQRRLAEWGAGRA